MSDNPLLLLEARALPAIATIRAEHVVPAIQQLADMVRDVAEQVATCDEVSWATVIAPLHDAENRLLRAWRLVETLQATRDSDAIRTAHEQAQALVVAVLQTVSQDARLYRRYQQIQRDDTLNAAQRKVMADGIRDFTRAGVDQDDNARAQLRRWQETLAQQGALFERHVLDAMNAFSDTPRDEKQLRGIPPSLLASYRGDDGTYCLPLSQPVYQTVAKFAADRDVRETFFTAWATRASTGATDNSEVMRTILRTRQQLATQLGFADYADYACAVRMASQPQVAIDFLRDIAARARPAAEAELATIRSLASEDGVDTLSPWDVTYYLERDKQRQFTIDDTVLRPYFPLPRVLDGLFALIDTLFAVKLVPQPSVVGWHDDVTCYAVHDVAGATIAHIYFDLFARHDKRSGAWMAEYRHRLVDVGGDQLPVAFVNCNFLPATAGKAALLTHEDVLTVFHEMGHALHHVLTTQTYLPISGIEGVEWDAVELPSQWLEHFGWETWVLRLISSHEHTGEPLPDALINALQASRTHGAGLFLLRQVTLGLFDLTIHRADAATVDPLRVFTEIRDEIAVTPTSDIDRLPMSFAHIFAGGYAAGYYSYLWAEVLACDAYTPFIGTPQVAAPGQKFLATILSQGAAKPMAALFHDYMGRAPDNNALLRSYGLAA